MIFSSTDYIFHKNLKISKLSLLFCFIAALLIRVYLISLRKYPSADEIWALFLIKNDFSVIWNASLSDFHAPFYFLALHLLGKILTIDLISLRLISLIFGILGNLGIWLLAKKIYGEKIALISLLASLFLTAFIWPAVFGRYYSFLIFLSVLVILFFINYLKTGSIKFLLFLVIVSIIGIYTHYYFLLLDLTLSIYLYFYKRKKFKIWLISLGIILIVLLPIVLYFFSLPKPEIAGRHSNDILKIPALLITNLISWEVLTFLYQEKSKLVAWILFLIFFSLSSLILVFKGFKSKTINYDFLLFSIALIPSIIAVLFSYTIRPFLALGSLIIFSPAHLILISKGLYYDWKQSKTISIIFIFSVLLSLVLLLKSSWSYAVVQNDFEKVLGEFRQDDLVLHSHIYSFIMASYYLGNDVNYGIGSAFSATPYSEKALFYKVISQQEILDHKGRIWFVYPPYDKREETLKIKKILDERLVLIDKEIHKDIGFQENDFDVYLYQSIAR